MAIRSIVIVDVRKEQAALKEAVTLGIPVVALVDTNSDPELVDFVIPGNDDGRDSIKVVMDYLAQAVLAGREQAKDVQTKEAAAHTEELAQKFAPEEIIIEDEAEVASAIKI